jgi:hypothetical protein
LKIAPGAIANAVSKPILGGVVGNGAQARRREKFSRRPIIRLFWLAVIERGLTNATYNHHGLPTSYVECSIQRIAGNDSRGRSSRSTVLDLRCFAVLE